METTAAAALRNLGMKDTELDRAQNLEEKAKQALDCPCVANLRNGPCGPQFSSAFVCYVKSQEPEKGSDCVAPFNKLQSCMLENEKHFIRPHSSEESPTNSERSTVDKFEEGVENQEPDTPQGPPAVPPEAIRYPPWYIRGK